MADRGGAVLRHMQTLFNVGTVAGLTDGELLERFTTRGEAAELAFAALVERHGPMVLRVCRRKPVRPRRRQGCLPGDVPGPGAQGPLDPHGILASWLYGVAFRVASCARKAAARRRAIERRYTVVECDRSTLTTENSRRCSSRSSIGSPSRTGRPSSSATWKD